MLLSVSRRSDIPAFGARWFAAQRQQGWVDVPSSHGAPDRRVSLLPEDVTGYVFWTRNPRPLFAELEAIRAEGTPFYVSHTFTAYPRWLEAHTPAPRRALDGMLELAQRFGPRALVWRYDPIVPTDCTPPDWHLERFGRIAARLQGATDEVVVSVVQSYAHADRNLARALQTRGAKPLELDLDAQQALVQDLANLAKSHGMRLRVCCQNHLLTAGIRAARCLDVDRLQSILDLPLPARVRPTRPDCTCHAALDIGRYDTCRHGCAYCYAVTDHQRVRHTPSLFSAPSP
jgi:hypothetical protein